MSIPVKDFSKQLKRTLEEAKKTAGSRENMQRLGNTVVDDIRKRTQLGYGVNKSEGKKQKLKKLADSTKLGRAGKLAFWTNKAGKSVPVDGQSSELSPKQIANNKVYINKVQTKLSSNTTANRSNLTYTGKMLESIGALVTGIGRVTIGFNTDRSARVAAFVSKARPFFFMTDKETKRITFKIEKLITESVEKAIRKFFN